MHCSRKAKFYILLTILWMIGIFLFSARPADLSSQDSSRLSRVIAMIRYPDFREWPEEEQLAFTESIDYPVRKAAHATEYAVLGIFLSLTLLSLAASPDPANALQLPETRRKLPSDKSSAANGTSGLSAYLPAWIITVCYAATDEIHQYFVPGRACRFTDVLIDACGAFLGILLFYLGPVLLLPLIRRVLRKR